MLKLKSFRQLKGVSAFITLSAKGLFSVSDSPFHFFHSYNEGEFDLNDQMQ